MSADVHDQVHHPTQHPWPRLEAEKNTLAMDNPRTSRRNLHLSQPSRSRSRRAESLVADGLGVFAVGRKRTAIIQNAASTFTRKLSILRTRHRSGREQLYASA